jgi:hypothetical protein
MSVLPQELQDKIFMYLDYSTLVECRELQSPFVHKWTEFDTLDKAVKNGNTNNVKYLIEQRKILERDIVIVCYAKMYNQDEILKYLNENRNNHPYINRMFLFDEMVENGKKTYMKFGKIMGNFLPYY